MTYCFKRTLKRRGRKPRDLAALRPTEEDNLCSFAENGLVERKKRLGSWICLRILALRPTSHSSAGTRELTSGHNLLDITKENSCFSSLGPITGYQFPTLFSSSSTTNQLSCKGPAPGGVRERERSCTLALGYSNWLQISASIYYPHNCCLLRSP